MKKLLNITILIFVFLASCANYKTAYPELSNTEYTGHYKIGNPYVIQGKTYTPRVQNDYDKTGIASWYGEEFHAKKTANGEIFDKNALTAAHKTLPLPSMVRVTNLDNGKTIILRVNDRGPFSKGRIIDVSKRASKILGFKDKGIAKVRVKFLPGQTEKLLLSLNQKAIKQPKTIAKEINKTKEEKIYVQVGAFSLVSNAQNMKSSIISVANSSIIEDYINNKKIYKVKIGPFINKDDAMEKIKQLKSLNKNGILISTK